VHIYLVVKPVTFGDVECQPGDRIVEHAQEGMLLVRRCPEFDASNPAIIHSPAFADASPPSGTPRLQLRPRRAGLGQP